MGIIRILCEKFVLYIKVFCFSFVCVCFFVFFVFCVVFWGREKPDRKPNEWLIPKSPFYQPPYSPFIEPYGPLSLPFISAQRSKLKTKFQTFNVSLFALIFCFQDAILFFDYSPHLTVGF